MNKIVFITLLALASLGFSQTYNQGSDYQKGGPVLLKNDWIAEFVIDVTLDTTDVAYSKAYDLARVPLVLFDTGAGSAVIIDLNMGDLAFSCYDNNDSSGAVDSVKVQVLTQISAYGADGNSPFGSKSDAWTTLHTDTVLDSSQAQALVETTRDFVISSEAARFVRWKYTNFSTSAADNSARCRGYWTRKKRVALN